MKILKSELCYTRQPMEMQWFHTVNGLLLVQVYVEYVLYKVVWMQRFKYMYVLGIHCRVLVQFRLVYLQKIFFHFVTVCQDLSQKTVVWFQRSSKIKCFTAWVCFRLQWSDKDYWIIVSILQDLSRDCKAMYKLQSCALDRQHVLQSARIWSVL
jgi:hypothetical protein